MQKHPEIFLAPGWDPIPGSVPGCPSGPFCPFCSHRVAAGIPRAGGSHIWPLSWAAWAGHKACTLLGLGAPRGPGVNMGMWAGAVSVGALRPCLCWHHTLLARIDGPSCGPFPAR